MALRLLTLPLCTLVASWVLSEGAVLAGEVDPSAAGAGAVVVLELFTSQGCSSCPPADALLSGLGGSEQWRERVVPLAYHVDYWDGIGWRDPFSQPAWTQRQQAYARAFGAGQVYTPQIVINGGTECVGSQERCVLQAIEQSRARAPEGRVALSLNRPEPGGRTVQVRVTAERSPGLSERELRLMVAVFESGLTTPVARGENAGRTLRNDFVVRRLVEAFRLSPNEGTRGEGGVLLVLEAGWNAEALGVAAFLQDAGSLEIHGAAVDSL